MLYDPTYEQTFTEKQRLTEAGSFGLNIYLYSDMFAEWGGQDLTPKEIKSQSFSIAKTLGANVVFYYFNLD